MARLIIRLSDMIHVVERLKRLSQSLLKTKGARIESEQMSLFPFTAHNIALPDGTRTVPEFEDLLEDGPAFKAAARMLKLVFPDGLAGKTIADLGCLEGGYATGFARLGMKATGFEIRDISLSRARYVADKLRLST
ncbi:MAG TPA: hypothetical protein VM782_07630, partial [Stellaceae bacterium]|nr:hypothetical protein [Stellaceae bacterium]